MIHLERSALGNLIRRDAESDVPDPSLGSVAAIYFATAYQVFGNQLSNLVSHDDQLHDAAMRAHWL